MTERFPRPSRAASSRRRRAIARTRPIGSKAPGPASPSRRATIGAARPRCRRSCCDEVGAALDARARGLPPQPQDRAPARAEARRRSRRARASTGRRPRRSPSARSAPRARSCASRARIAAAAPSRSATPCWSIRRPRSATSRSTTCATGQAPFEVHRQPALRGGGARLRIRLQPRRAARARPVGGAVRRFRQRRAGHHRPVHRLGRGEVAAHVGPRRCCCRTATRGRGRSIPRRGSSASSSSAARTICRSATSPRAANYFHALRRQVRRNFRKPLDHHDAEIAAAQRPSSRRRSTRWGRARRSTASSTRSTRSRADDKVRRVVLCSGKVYFDLLQARRERKIDDVAILRLEQLYPFPAQTLGADAGALPQRRVGVVPGRAGEHGRLDLRRPPHRDGRWRRSTQGQARRAMSAGPKRRRPPPACCKRHNAEQARLVDEALAPPERGTRGTHGDRDHSARAGRIGHRGDGRALAQEGRRQPSRSTIRWSSSRPTR